MVWRTIGGRRVNVRRGRRRHLYSNKRDRAYERREFTVGYGGRKGRYVYGAVVGKVRREQAAAGTRPHREVVRAHRSRSRRGRGFRVRRSVRYI
jgi:hypothetical protein